MPDYHFLLLSGHSAITISSMKKLLQILVAWWRRLIHDEAKSPEEWEERQW